MTSCLFPLWMGQIMYNMFRLGFCLIKKKKKKCVIQGENCLILKRDGKKFVLSVVEKMW